MNEGGKGERGGGAKMKYVRTYVREKEDTTPVVGYIVTV